MDEILEVEQNLVALFFFVEGHDKIGSVGKSYHLLRRQGQAVIRRGEGKLDNLITFNPLRIRASAQGDEAGVTGRRAAAQNGGQQKTGEPGKRNAGKRTEADVENGRIR